MSLNSRPRTVAGVVAAFCLVVMAGGCAGDEGFDAAQGEVQDSTTTTAPTGGDEAITNELVDADGRLAFPAPRLAEPIELTEQPDGGATVEFSVTYAVANPSGTDGAAPDRADLTLRVARSLLGTGPNPNEPIFATTVADTELDHSDITRDYSVELSEEAYQHLLDHGVGSDDPGSRAAALRLVNVGVQHSRDFRTVDGTLDWIHGATFDGATSPTGPADNPGGSVTVTNDTGTGISSFDWSNEEPVAQEYGSGMLPDPSGIQSVSSDSQGVSIVLAGQAVSCLYQGTDGSNPDGFTTTLAPGAAITQTIVANDESRSQPSDAGDTAEISNAVVTAIGAGLKAVADLTDAPFSAPFTAIVKMADAVFDLGTACNNQPNLFQLGAVTADGQGTNNTTWAIWDDCDGTCGGLSNYYSSPWSSSAPNVDASIVTDAVQLAPDTGVTYQGQPLWLAQIPTGGCGVGNASDANTSGCTAANTISLRWMTEAPCPWTNGLANASNGGVSGDVSWCYQPAPSSPSIAACGSNNAECLAYEPTS